MDSPHVPADAGGVPGTVIRRLCWARPMGLNDYSIFTVGDMSCNMLAEDSSLDLCNYHHLEITGKPVDKQAKSG